MIWPFVLPRKIPEAGIHPLWLEPSTETRAATTSHLFTRIKGIVQLQCTRMSSGALLLIGFRNSLWNGTQPPSVCCAQILLELRVIHRTNLIGRFFSDARLRGRSRVGMARAPGLCLSDKSRTDMLPSLSGSSFGWKSRSSEPFCIR